ncbi:MAG: zinc-dependent metalloprotease [Planctomycetota bacterium]
MTQTKFVLRILILLAIASSSAFAPGLLFAQNESADEEEKGIPTIEERTEGLRKTDGYIPFYWDNEEGKILLELTRGEEEFLYVHSLATGLGSNPVGLDRGQLGDQKIVRFTRIGPRVLMMQRNLRFRAVTDNELEQRSVEQSFAESVIWGGEVVAETDGVLLIDITSLLLSDIHGVIETLSNSDQGDFSLDDSRSAVFLDACKAFPENTELESTLTFTGDDPGRFVQQTAPTPRAITLRQHHSFIQLPDDEYQPRKYDVRSPCMFITFADYASPLDESLEHRWILRHRLKKSDPDANTSEAVEPIVYYVDAGAPELIQQALVEGASWWNEAFESAGFENAFRVEILPPDADPLDVRYNVIQWVHRSTRGWSYGGSVIDPRTGEIIKGHVTLGSLRVRQDQLLFNGLTSPLASSAQCACCGISGIVEDSTLADFDDDTDALEVALARIRQLSAHEVGHTLGFVHNFAASTYADRASVMDYPAPRVNVAADGTLDLSDAYGTGIGEWDKVSVQFAYTELPAELDESIILDDFLNQASANGYIFISDADARPAGAAHPLANLWDNGNDPIEELEHVMRVRRIALDNFDPAAMPAGTTTADIAQYFTPLYLHHRYQLNAAGKVIAGHLYEYGYSSGNQPAGEMIPVDRQKAALEALLKTLDPAELAIPADVMAAISPRPHQTIRDVEIMDTNSGRIFDPLASARVAADLTLDELFQHQRLNRLSIHARQSIELSPEVFIPAVVERILENCPAKWSDDLTTIQIGQVIREALFEKLIELADHPGATGPVRSGALMGVYRFAFPVEDEDAAQTENAFGTMLQRRARQFIDRPFASPPELDSLTTPPGSPIGN